MTILVDIQFVFINLFLLIVWFNTDAFIEYLKYIPYFKKYLKIDEYFKFRLCQDLSYPNFLVIKYNNFFTKLISCPKCLNFWFCLIFLCLYSMKVNLFFVYFTSILLYNIYSKTEKYE
jgi:hypothetical protein